jgi:SAM-dependent methyltransferase
VIGWRRAASCLVLALVLGAGTSVALRAQLTAFDFYPEFREWWFALPPDQRQTLEAVLAGYERRLRDQGTASMEIERRLTLIRTKRPELEADFWNRFFTVGAPKFNTAPNGFLVSVVQGRTPGKALDVGMGDGRNALYLAKLGWQVTGFDPADKAVAWRSSAPASCACRSRRRSRTIGTLRSGLRSGTLSFSAGCRSTSRRE